MYLLLFFVCLGWLWWERQKPPHSSPSFPLVSSTPALFFCFSFVGFFSQKSSHQGSHMMIPEITYGNYQPEGWEATEANLKAGCLTVLCWTFLGDSRSSHKNRACWAVHCPWSVGCPRTFSGWQVPRPDPKAWFHHGLSYPPHSFSQSHQSREVTASPGQGRRWAERPEYHPSGVLLNGYHRCVSGWRVLHIVRSLASLTCDSTI